MATSDSKDVFKTTAKASIECSEEDHMPECNKPYMATSEGDLFDINLIPKPPKHGRRIRKRPVFIEENIKFCYCRFCKISNEAVEPQNVSMPQVLKVCVIKIIHHCLMGCLKSEDNVDGNNETELINSLCIRLSMPHVLWVIISITDKMDKLYFTRDTFDDLKTFIQCIKNSHEPLSLMSKTEAELPLALKRIICQNVTEINYNKLLKL
ncbi:uncharacterized protein LOC116521077 [Thamnophis elegans]|uniref:uncharacterized protein LOC116521077 n=1 Tax=Thamnophis elegans TaxID=35005 RepID=UPI001378ACEF|nr:uncharacterized protein LOC116521077 [Thamnophis elegans]